MLIITIVIIINYQIKQRKTIFVFSCKTTTETAQLSRFEVLVAKSFSFTFHNEVSKMRVCCISAALLTCTDGEVFECCVNSHKVFIFEPRKTHTPTLPVFEVQLRCHTHNIKAACHAPRTLTLRAQNFLFLNALTSAFKNKNIMTNDDIFQQ